MFKFIPQGFFSHLVARSLQNQQLQDKEAWKDTITMSYSSFKVVLKITSTQRDFLQLQV